MSNLREVAELLAKARRVAAQAKKDIEELTPIYFQLLDEEYGDGPVTFDHNGMRYGRIIADKSSFNLDRMRAERPDLWDVCVVTTEKYSLDEDKLNDYLAEHPEEQQIVQKFVDEKTETRWKPPVKVKEQP